MIKKKIKNLINTIKNNRGITLVEMLVCFAMLGIFMVAAFSVISRITMLYYNIKGEIYEREVSDIIMEKAASEIDGALYFDDKDKSGGTNPQVASDNSYIDLYDKTNTHVKLGKNDSRFNICYYKIEVKNADGTDSEETRNETDWYFDDNMYNGFEVSDMRFYIGGESATILDATKYGLAGVNLSEYDKNVVLITLHLHSGRYGDYYSYRFVRMYNVDPNPSGGETNP